MGLMPAGPHSQFTRLDKQSVIGSLKSCGSRDPDVLFAQKQQLVAPARHLKLLGYICLAGGALFTVTIILSWFGVPLMIFGWWVQRFGKNNIRTIDAAYEEFLAAARL
jgi:hypothetical protein